MENLHFGKHVLHHDKAIHAGKLNLAFVQGVQSNKQVLAQQVPKGLLLK